MQFGAPHEIVTDRGSSFNASVLKEYLDIQRIHHFPSTPYHPQTNGMDERSHRVLKSIITKMSEGARDKWDLFLPSAVFSFNARRHTVTGYSPFFLCYGFEPRLPQDVHPPVVFDLSKEADRVQFTERELIRLGQARGAALYRTQKQALLMQKMHAKNPRVASSRYEPGELVKLKNHVKKTFEFDFHGPFVIDRLAPNHAYFLKSPDGMEIKNPVNQANLEKYHSPEDNPSLSISDSNSNGGYCYWLDPDKSARSLLTHHWFKVSFASRVSPFLCSFQLNIISWVGPTLLCLNCHIWLQGHNSLKTTTSTQSGWILATWV